MKLRPWHYISFSGTTLICLILGVVSGMLSARILGPAGRGEYAILAYFPGVLGSMFSLGTPEALGFLLGKQNSQSKAIITAGIHIAVFLSLLGAFAFCFLAPYGLSEGSDHLREMVRISCLLAPAMVINPHLYCLLRNTGRSGFVNCMLLLSASGYILVILMLWYLGLATPWSLNLGSLFIQSLISCLCLFQFAGVEIFRRADFSVYWSCLSQGLKFFFPAVAFMFYTIADRFLLIRTTTSMEIGYFAVALAISNVASLSVDAFKSLGFVDVAAADNKSDKISLTISRFKAAQFVMLGTVSVLALLAYPLVLFGFGKEFLPALNVFWWLLPAMGIRALFSSLDYLSRAMNIVLPGVVASVLGLGLLVVLALSWCPQLGALGFGKAYVCSQLVSLSIMLWGFWFILKIPISRLLLSRADMLKFLNLGFRSL